MSRMIERSERACAATLVMVTAAAGGCASGRTYVLTRPSPQRPFTEVHLAEGESTVLVSDELKRHFESSLRAALRSGGTRDAGSGGPLVVRYRIVGFDRGDPAGRVFNGAIQVVGVPVSGIGDGGVGVEAVYLDAHGREIGRIVADGPIAGLFGSPRGGLSQAARSIAEYTREHFTPGRPGTARRDVAASPVAFGGIPVLADRRADETESPRGVQ